MISKLALVLAAAVVLHPEGTLKLETKIMTPGSPFHLMGEKFGKNETFDVVLAGPSRRTQLKHITSDADGSFHDFVIAPEGLPPGSYRLVLIASDDDEAASADIQLAAGGGTSAAAPAEGAHDMSKMNMGGASAEPLQLARARSPWVTGGAFGVIALALAIGGAAVLRQRAS